MTPHEILTELARRGVTLRAEGDRIIVKPLSAVPPELREAARVHKQELLELLATQPESDAKQAPPSTADDPASQALAVLARLRVYSVPAGRMEAAKRTVELLQPLLSTSEDQVDPAAALSQLQMVESELIELGAQLDPEITAAIEAVTHTFPGARLVAIKQ